MKEISIRSSLSEIEKYLKKELNIFSSDEQVHNVEVPGEGNMNVVLRVETNKKSFILKQSRPYVNKYPNIKNSEKRIIVEDQFYELIIKSEIQKFFPKKIDFIKKDLILLIEDLGQCRDMSYLYSSKNMNLDHFNSLIYILESIHKTKVNSFPSNYSLKELNHEHIFVLPFQKNDFQLDDIQSGLKKLSTYITNDSNINDVVKRIGDMYLKVGNTLLHGDYYPGSWMQKDDNVYVIDPEFSHLGFKEFDLGVMAAHLTMITESEDYLNKIIKAYSENIDKSIFYKVSGIEIIRRIIGLAQLPLDMSLNAKEKLLNIAKKMILS
ncbi:MAG: phosphotransferase [Flavobacteriaceae bacterium]